MGHGGHPVGVRGLDDGGHGQAGRRRGDDGRRREGDHPGQGDVVHHQGVVAVVKGAQVASHTEALFCMRKNTGAGRDPSEHTGTGRDPSEHTGTGRDPSEHRNG